VDGTTSEQWQYIRETANNPESYPVEDVSSEQMACFEKSGRAAADVQSIAAGSEIGFVSSGSIGHPGPFLYYMARVPDDVTDVDSWNPAGEKVWFKIDQGGNVPDQNPPFETEMTEIFTTIPADLAPGNYLLRAEHIGLHINGGPQFYIACAQLEVTGSGSASPSSLVAFPGAYALSDPGLAWNLYADSGPYPYPGPEVWGN
jgi:hypothetical protein